MSLDRVFNIAGLIVGVGMATVVLSSPNTSRVITSLGNAFSGSLRAAMGK